MRSWRYSLNRLGYRGEKDLGFFIGSTVYVNGRAKVLEETFIAAANSMWSPAIYMKRDLCFPGGGEGSKLILSKFKPHDESAA